MSDFTKGKWTVCNDSSIKITDSTGKVLHYYLDLFSDPEVTQDFPVARLIVYAPKMYRLLDDARGILNQLNLGDPY